MDPMGYNMVGCFDSSRSMRSNTLFEFFFGGSVNSN